MVKISKRIAQVAESPTLATSAKVKELKAQGHDIISLTVGEPDFETPKQIRDAAIEAISQNKVNHYTPAAGILPLRQAIVDYYQKYEGLDYQINQVIVTEGAKNALYSLFQVLLDEGDEVMILAPYWVSYTEQVKLAGGVNVIIEAEMENQFKVTVDELEKHRTDKTVAIVLNSPNNPTGSIYSKEELTAIGNWAVEHDIVIVADEIYAKLCYNGNEAVSIASLSEEIKKQTIIINGVSKTYAMTGWRIGYALGNKEVIGKMIDLANHSTSNPAGPSQYAALAALEGEQDFVEKMRQTYEKRLSHFFPLLESIPGFRVLKPQGAFYVFAHVKEAAEQTGYQSVSDFSLAMIEEAKVAVVSGDGFGFPDYVRISYTQDEETLTEAVNRIKAFIEKKTKE
ncbi:pyridoxal phosphate-dependent aminotransferase [Jeotgalibaca caeni]|uniref:pyridoxal phosphate-dependent aminotransferase n=1 Tax=Jeotgalibaca caeni TaxID=3028623 RepID=UPI00237E231A|nr:pyridoxal phosphate-dependent aminotransferase [Jeotgalibaca caeni]MDE1549072.1 pyridoxal phosphate-dependent aminotransferase [Jeotgalibaca caeni]